MSKRVSLEERLSLYVVCVQNPEAEVRLLGKIHAGMSDGEPMLLREDFCGTGALACAWVASDPDRQAMGVDQDAKTLEWAWERAQGLLGEERAQDLHLVEGDVVTVGGPKVDLVCALNFSVFELHTREALVGYFKKCRSRLNAGGVAAVDAYYGPGAFTVGEETRKFEKAVPVPGRADAVRYVWEQRSVDLVTSMVENHIHVELKDKTRLESLFTYRWRLWSPRELSDAMTEAGFDRVSVWCDTDETPGRYEALKALPARKNVVVYVAGAKG